jgi:sirohydrochlorin cobaltochelatase
MAANEKTGRPSMHAHRILSLIAALSLLFTAADGIAAHGEKPPAKKAILLVAFGTSDPQAAMTFDLVEKRVRERFSGVELRWAFTSRTIRAKLAREGKVLNSPETTMAKLMDDGYTHVAVLSLHTIPGEEFHELLQNARLFAQMAGGFQRVLVARPLLSSAKDMETVARVLLQNVPGRKAGEAVVFMGHGSEHHPADALYLAMNQVFQELDSNAYVAVVEGSHSLDHIIPKLKKHNVKKVFIAPLMSVAGEHAKNDMAGGQADSWKSILTEKGFEVEPLLKGTAEYAEIVDVWLDHLQASFSHF